MSFDQFNFDRRIVAGIDSCNFTTPTPIQDRAIPIVLEGKDVMGLAQTGTGKTAAFALPILQRLLDDRANGRGPVRVLVLAPTRELALQIHETFVELGGKTGIRSTAVFGGVGQAPQVRDLGRSAVTVACPGRLLDLINQGVVDLSHVDTLVLDEADRMLDMGFLPDIKRILSRLPAKRQNLLFSATMPTEIKKLSSNLLSQPETVQVANTKPVEKIEQVFYGVEKHLKASFVETYLKSHEHESVLIFTRTKHLAKRLGKKLSGRGFSATSLQGNLSQNQRVKALDGFRDGTYQIMFATDIAARGIDCSRISHVINYDVPDTVETYTHRIGRTGRADRTGVALTLVTRDDRDFIRDLERSTKSKVQLQELEEFDHQAPRPPRQQNAGDRGNPRRADTRGGGRSARGKGEARGRGRRKDPQASGDGQPGGKGRGSAPKKAGKGKPTPAAAHGEDAEKRTSPGILPERRKSQEQAKRPLLPRPRPNRKPVEGIGQIRDLNDYAPASETGDSWKEVKDAPASSPSQRRPSASKADAPDSDGPVSQMDSYLYEDREIHDRRPEPGPDDSNPYASDFSLDALAEDTGQKKATGGGKAGSGKPRQRRSKSAKKNADSGAPAQDAEGKKRPRRGRRGGKGRKGASGGGQPASGASAKQGEQSGGKGGQPKGNHPRASENSGGQPGSGEGQKKRRPRRRRRRPAKKPE